MIAVPPWYRTGEPIETEQDARAEALGVTVSSHSHRRDAWTIIVRRGSEKVELRGECSSPWPIIAGALDDWEARADSWTPEEILTVANQTPGMEVRRG